MDPWFVYWSLAAGFALIVLGVVFTQAAYTDRCLFSRMDKRCALAPALAGALLCAVCLWGVTAVSSPLPQASQAEYSRYTRFASGDEEHMYYIHTDLTPDVREELRAVDNATLKEEAVVRDPMKSFQTVNSWFYVDDRYIYYAICNNLFGDSSGELNVYRVDKATYAETLVYTEANEAWGGGNTTRYLGIVNVDGYGNLTATEKNEKSLTDMWVDGDNLFLADRRYVYRINLKTGDKQTVWEGTRYQENMAYSGGTLYYVDRLHDAYGVDTNTQKRTKLAIPKATEVFPYHGDLYFIDTQGHIGAYDAQKQQYTILSQNQVLSWSNVSGGDGWLYFFNEENVLCRVSTDGKEETLPQYGHVTDCAAFDGSDWLYISRLEGEDVISGFVAAP